MSRIARVLWRCKGFIHQPRIKYDQILSPICSPKRHVLELPWVYWTPHRARPMRNGCLGREGTWEKTRAYKLACLLSFQPLIAVLPIWPKDEVLNFRNRFLLPAFDSFSKLELRFYPRPHSGYRRTDYGFQEWGKHNFLWRTRWQYHLCWWHGSRFWAGGNSKLWIRFLRAIERPPLPALQLPGLLHSCANRGWPNL